jgi:hypothetical protein
MEPEEHTRIQVEFEKRVNALASDLQSFVTVLTYEEQILSDTVLEGYPGQMKRELFEMCARAELVQQGMLQELLRSLPRASQKAGKNQMWRILELERIELERTLKELEEARAKVKARMPSNAFIQETTPLQDTIIRALQDISLIEQILPYE